MDCDSDEIVPAAGSEVVLLEPNETNSERGEPKTPPHSPPLWCEKMTPKRTFHRSRNGNESHRGKSRAILTQTARINNLSSSEKQYETIETHFVNNGEIFFVVYNEAAGGTERETKLRTPAKLYGIKPVWYMTGTHALRDYYNSKKMDGNDKALVPIYATLGGNQYGARPMKKLSANIYSCRIETNLEDPKPLDEQRDYSLHMPKDWTQLARHRLYHHKIDRVVACAVMQEGGEAAGNGCKRGDGGGSTVNVYFVRWQNEFASHIELLPAEFLEKFTQHDCHHQMVLDLWEESCVQDLRAFHSAFSIGKDRQETALKTNEKDQFWIKCVHRFRPPPCLGSTSKAKRQELFVYKYIDWPLTIARVYDKEIPGTDIVTPEMEAEAEELDPRGLDEYVQLVVHDKFVYKDGKLTDPLVKVEELSAAKLKKYCNIVRYTAHVPRHWRKLGEQHAAANGQVRILGVFRQMAIANVYLVQWPSYDHPTFVTSLTLRKRHARDMVTFFEQKGYWPEMQLYERKRDGNRKKSH